MTMLGMGLGVLGSILGIWNSVLGFSAARHLARADAIDKAIGWSLWWCLDTSRYDEEGRLLCRRGQVLAFLAIALWIAAYAIRPS